MIVGEISSGVISFAERVALEVDSASTSGDGTERVGEFVWVGVLVAMTVGVGAFVGVFAIVGVGVFVGVIVGVGVFVAVCVGAVVVAVAVGVGSEMVRERVFDSPAEEVESPV